MVQGFFGVLLEALGIFWVLTFGSIRSSPSLEIPSTPLWGYLPFFGVKEVHYTSLSGSRALSSRHFPSGLREKRFGNVGKKHASTVPRQILNHGQPKLHNHYCHNSYWLLHRKIFQNNYLEFTLKDDFSVK